MNSPNSQCFIVKTFVAFSIAIAFGLLGCKAKKDLSERTPYSKTHHHSFTHVHDMKNVIDFIHLYNSSMQISINEISRVLKDFSEDGQLTRKIKEIDKNLQSPIETCRELLSLALLYNLNLSPMPTHETLEDKMTWLCATMTELKTCLDGFEYAPEEVRKIMTKSMESSRKYVGNNLSILHNINDLILGSNSMRKPRVINDQPPSWLSSKDRKLVFGKKGTVDADVVVAKDGSGHYETINEAVKVVPEYSTKRFVIYVKEGIYNENVNIGISKCNVMMVGDGMNNTIVSGMLSHSSGKSTTATATFSVHGPGFIARDMGFQNTAGPSSGQAVALLSSSDKSVIYKCSIDAYQDTLYAKSNRQFYRECYIKGTIDFIFGESSAVFQKCTISVKKPLEGQNNVITAQGKSDPLCRCGFSIQHSTVVAAEDLGGARTFLGRPWQNFSTTVFMESYLDSLIDPEGWSEWIPNVTPPDTIYYGEFKNNGPGARTDGRVQWKGVRVNMSVEEANKFTVRELIGGDQWIPQTGVDFFPDF